MSIHFRDGTSVDYTPPADTLDPRYGECVNHHPACDCREAAVAEERSECAAAWSTLRQAVDVALAGHAVRTFGRGPECQCAGCQIARAVHVYPRQMPTCKVDADENDTAEESPEVPF
ncbi:hypothetical protein GCM10027294_25370 [Marinactinospora endophytica]